MPIRTRPAIKESEITDPRLYAERRRFLVGAAGLIGAAALGAMLPMRRAAAKDAIPDRWTAADFAEPVPGPYGTDEEKTAKKDIAGYNNFYEFGTDKEDPARYAGTLRPRPWSVAVDGLVEKPASYALEDFVKPSKLEERVYRMRCVEGWSMVIPWIGFPLSDILDRARPKPNARYVAFATLAAPDRMPGLHQPVLDWPYVEGLRLDEAMHPLAILATGLYGDPLPNQNGAPLRLVVPWKYGFKGIKSIVRIRLTDAQPPTTWNKANAREYGFYSNVNPEVDHPRWSQATERRIGEFRRRKTLVFNGYADEVAALYSGMDLKTNF